MKLKTVRNNLLKYKNTPFDGQDYETVAHLIAGNQLIAAANFIDRLDTMVRDTMKIVIMKTCPKISLEMFGVTEFYTYGDDDVWYHNCKDEHPKKSHKDWLDEDQGTWSEFAEEGLVQ